MKSHFTVALTAFFGALFGAFVALVFNDRQHDTRKSRKLQDFAPTYKTLVEKYTGDDQLYEDHDQAWIKFVREAVRADLTELEAEQVAQAILSFQAPAYNYQQPLFPYEEKQE